MGFFGSIIKSAVKVAVTPVAIVADIVSVVKCEVPDNTISLLGSAAEDAVDSVEDLLNGEL